MEEGKILAVIVLLGRSVMGEEGEREGGGKEGFPLCEETGSAAGKGARLVVFGGWAVICGELSRVRGEKEDFSAVSRGRSGARGTAARDARDFRGIFAAARRQARGTGDEDARDFRGIFAARRRRTRGKRETSETRGNGP